MVILDGKVEDRNDGNLFVTCCTFFYKGLQYVQFHKYLYGIGDRIYDHITKYFGIYLSTMLPFHM